MKSIKLKRLAITAAYIVNDDPDQTTTREVDATIERPGMILKKARETQKFTENDIASALNLPISIVQSIEADLSSGARQSVFIRGYIRSYARLMDLNADALVDLYDELGESKHTVSLSTVGSGNIGTISSIGMEKDGFSPPRWILVSLSVLIFLLVILWIGKDFIFDGGDKISQIFDVQGVTTVEEFPKAIDRNENQHVLDSTISIPKETLGMQKEDSNKDVLSLRLESKGQISNELIALDLLELSFVEDSWVEIQDGMGGLIYGDLSRAGSTLEISGVPPLKILLGYAHGVSLVHNGDVVALAPHTRNNVASLVLGR